jgi:hypothetical protein
MLLTALALTCQLLATQPLPLVPDAPPPPRLPSDRAARQDRADARRIQGAVLMAMGIAHLIPSLVLGSVALDAGLRCRRSPGCDDYDYVTRPVVAGALLSLGVIFTAVGVPLYVVGTNHRARLKLEPRAGGLAVRF